MPVLVMVVRPLSGRVAAPAGPIRAMTAVFTELDAVPPPTATMPPPLLSMLVVAAAVPVAVTVTEPAVTSAPSSMIADTTAAAVVEPTLTVVFRELTSARPPDADEVVARALWITSAETTVAWAVVMVAFPIRAAALPVMVAVASSLVFARIPPVPPLRTATTDLVAGAVASPTATVREPACTTAPSATWASSASPIVAVPLAVVLATPMVPLPMTMFAVADVLEVARTVTAPASAVTWAPPSSRACVRPPIVVIASTFATATPIPMAIEMVNVSAWPSAEVEARTETPPVCEVRVPPTKASTTEPTVFWVKEFAPAPAMNPAATDTVGRTATMLVVSLAAMEMVSRAVTEPVPVKARVREVVELMAVVPAPLKAPTPPATAAASV